MFLVVAPVATLIMCVAESQKTYSDTYRVSSGTYRLSLDDTLYIAAIREKIYNI